MFLLFFVAAFVALLTFQLWHTRRKAGLRSVPGPYLASVSNLWKINAVYFGEMHRKNIEVHKKYGPVVRIGPNYVSFSSLTALKTIYNSRTQFVKSDFYKPLSPLHNGKILYNLFSVQDVEYHAKLKRTIGGIFTPSAVLDLEPKIDSTLDLFMSKLTLMTAARPCELNMSMWPHLFAFDALGDLTLSHMFGFIETGTDVRNMIETADRIYNMTGLFGQSPLLQDLSSRIKARWTKTRPNPILMMAAAQAHARIANGIRKHDMLDNLIEIHKLNPKKLSVDDVAGAIYINLMAGHDVLAISLRALFYYLARHKDVKAKLRAELAILNESHPLPKNIPYSKLSKLTYLDAVVHESLRIHANTGVMLERVVPNDGYSIDGTWLPGGTVVGVNAWVIHQNEEIFGPDAASFNPERWLNISDEQLSQMKRHIFSFGAGSRRCIGYNFATALSSKLIAEFIRRFDMTLVEPNKEWHIHGSWVTKQTEMDMLISRL